LGVGSGTRRIIEGTFFSKAAHTWGSHAENLIGAMEKIVRKNKVARGAKIERE
jgi:hypothetical protein